MALRTLNYGNYGIFLLMGNAGVCHAHQHSINSKSLSCMSAIPYYGNLFVPPQAPAEP